MNVYSVRYKTSSGPWEQLENIHTDGFIFVEKVNMNYRFFILENGERWEVPCQGTIFRFSPERETAIQLKQRNEK